MTTRAASPTRIVGSFLRRTFDPILEEWRRAARKLPAGGDSAAIALGQDGAALLEKLAMNAEAILAGVESAHDDATRGHEIDSLTDRFGVAEVMRALALLRRCILAVWGRGQDGIGTSELQAIHEAIDDAIAASIARDTAAVTVQCERTLAKLESLLSAAPVGIGFVDRELRYRRVNDALAAINGRPAAEHLGQRVVDVLPAEADRLVPLLQQVLDSGEPVHNLELSRPRDGHVETFLASFFPVRSTTGTLFGVGAIVFDVTELKQAQHALRVEQVLLEAIIEHAPAAIWIKDAAGRIIVANHRLAEALSTPYDELLGKRSDEVLPPAMAEQHQAHDQIVTREGRAIEAEEATPAADGERTFLSIKFPIPGDPPFVGGIATEITERKRMEQQLRDAVRTREDLLAIVSHDLRNPLGTIQLSATLLGSQLGADPKAHRHLEVIHRSSTRMEELIEDLLDTASIRAGKFQLEKQSEVIDDVVTEALDLQETLAQEKRITIHRTLDVKGLRIDCDRQRIQQVFGNLIGNAIKFCAAGGTITVTGTRDGESVRFGVIDNGPGIADELLPVIFEPYSAGRRSTNAGSGLGLYIVRGIVESHGGSISVESKPGAGARFYFTLPIVQTDPR